MFSQQQAIMKKHPNIQFLPNGIMVGASTTQIQELSIDRVLDPLSLTVNPSAESPERLTIAHRQMQMLPYTSHTGNNNFLS